MGDSLREVFKSGKGIIVVGRNKEDIYSCQKMLLHFIDVDRTIKVLDNSSIHRKLIREFKDINIINVKTKDQEKITTDWHCHPRRYETLTYIPLIKESKQAKHVIEMSYLSSDTVLSGIISENITAGMTKLLELFKLEDNIPLDTAKDITYSEIGYVVSISHFKNITIFKINWDKENDNLDLSKEA